MREKFYEKLRTLGVTEAELEQVVKDDVYQQFRMDEFFNDCELKIVDAVGFGKYVYQLEKELIRGNDNAEFLLESIESAMDDDFYIRYGCIKSGQKSEYYKELDEDRYLIVIEENS